MRHTDMQIKNANILNIPTRHYIAWHPVFKVVYIDKSQMCLIVMPMVAYSLYKDA